MATNPGDYWDYIFGGSGKGMAVPNAPLPVVAITTTAGTGTEADPWTVITKDDTHEKIGFGYDKTFPVLSIVDPDLMMTVPPHLTAYQGFDALFHSTEGYIATVANPISDVYALKAIELVGQWLPTAVADGSHEEARANVALANTLAGMVESTSCCTSEHSLEHALSAYHPALPHGAGLIIVSLAYYTHFAERHACDDRLVAMAKALGKADASTPMDFVEALSALQKACGVANLKMSDYGIEKHEMAKYAANARLDDGRSVQGRSGAVDRRRQRGDSVGLMEVAGMSRVRRVRPATERMPLGLMLAASVLLHVPAVLAQSLPWMNPALAPADRAAKLVAAMTLEQKQQQLVGNTPELVPELPQCQGGAARPRDRIARHPDASYYQRTGGDRPERLRRSVRHRVRRLHEPVVREGNGTPVGDRSRRLLQSGDGSPLR